MSARVFPLPPKKRPHSIRTLPREIIRKTHRQNAVARRNQSLQGR